jgi:hypothetical protein
MEKNKIKKINKVEFIIVFFVILFLIILIKAIFVFWPIVVWLLKMSTISIIISYLFLLFLNKKSIK